MNITDKPQRHPEATHETVAAEAIIILLSTNTYYSLNDTGTMFWQRLDGQHSLADCAREIAAEYDVTPDVVEVDLLELAEDLQKEGLIIV